MKNFFSKIFSKHTKRTEASAPKPQPAQTNTIVLREVAGSDHVVFKDLILLDPDNVPLINYGSITLAPGDRMMLSGPAGCGKSAGLSAMRNAWLLGGSGDITVPPEVRFVPQEEYFPDRTLCGIVCAPDAVSRFTREQIVQALTDADLAEFIEAMDDPAKKGEYWRNTLSGGQKNKLAFAGIFLHAPEIKVLVIDEVTAALDAQSEAALYPKLLERMRHGIVITIAHHASITSLHNVIATVADGKVSYTKTAPPAISQMPEKASTMPPLQGEP